MDNKEINQSINKTTSEILDTTAAITEQTKKQEELVKQIQSAQQTATEANIQLLEQQQQALAVEQQTKAELKAIEQENAQLEHMVQQLHNSTMKVPGANITRGAAGNSSRAARRNAVKKAFEANQEAMSKELWKVGKFGWDTETTGVTADDVPVTFGLSGKNAKGQDIRIDKFLHQGIKANTIKALTKAMNVPDGKQGFIDSAMQLRKRLELSTKDQITDADIEKIWESKIAKDLVTPADLQKIFKGLNIDKSTAAERLYSYNGVNFDMGKMQTWFNNFTKTANLTGGAKAANTKAQKALTETFQAHIKNDVMQVIRKALVFTKDVGTKKAGESLLGEGKHTVKGSSTLQRMVQIVAGAISEGRHGASDDGANTLDVMASAATTNMLNGIRDALQDAIEEAAADNPQMTNASGYYVEGIQNAINQTLDDLTGAGNEKFDETQINEEINGNAADKAQIQKLLKEFSPEQVKSMTGSELRERYKNRAGKDVSGITGQGANSRGTTAGKLQELVQLARAKGYTAVFRKQGDNQIGIMLVPDAQYDPNNIDWSEEAGHIKFNIAVGNNGRINNKINKAVVGTEFYEENGKTVARAMLETAETAQLSKTLAYLKGDKFGNDGRTNDEISHMMQTFANESINQSVPLDSRAYDKNLALKEKLDDTDVSGGLTEKEAIKSTEFNIRDYVSGILRNEKVQKAIKAWYTSRKKNADYLDFNNPSAGMVSAIIDAFHISGNGIDTGRLESMSDDQLLKFVLTSDEFAFLRYQAAEIIGATGTDYTGESEGSHRMGRVGVTSSKTFTAGGNLIDQSQRSLTQAYNTLELTDKALEARKGNTHQEVMATDQGLKARINYKNDAHGTVTLASITAEQYDQLQREYYESLGYTGEALEEQLLSLEDKALFGDKLADMTESLQEKTVSSLATEDLNDSLLNKLGLTQAALSSEDFVTGSTLSFNNYKLTADDAAAFGIEGLEEGDELQSLIKDVEGWKIKVKKLKETEEGTKLALRVGARVTSEKNEGKFQFMKNKLGLGDDVAGIVQQSEIEARKYGPEFLGQLEYIISSAIQAGKSVEDIYQVLEKTTPVLANIFKTTDGMLVDKIKTDEKTGQFYSVNANGKRVNLFENEEETAKEFSQLGNLAAELGVAQNNQAHLLRTAVGQHDVWDYQETSGAGTEGRVRNDFKVRNAHKRNLEFTKDAKQINIKQVVNEKGELEEVERTAEEKAQIQTGLDSLIDQQLEIDSALSESTILAQKQRAALKESWQSMNSKSGYSSKATDVEFVTKASLNGEAAKENQIIIEDVMTDFKKELDEGRLTADQYEEFAMTKARKLLAELKKKKIATDDSRIVLDTSMNAVGKKKVVLADIEGTKGVEGKYMPSQTDRWNAKMLNAAVSDDQAKWDEIEREVQNDINYAVDNKNSQLYEDATHNYVEHSAFSILEGISGGAKLNAKQANTVYMDSSRFRGMRQSNQGASKEALKKNVQSLYNEFKTRSKDTFEEIKKSPDLFAQIDISEIEKLTYDELKAIEDRIIEAEITDIKHGNSNYTTRMGRYPYTQGKEGNLHRIGIKEGLGDTVQMSQGLLRSYRGDTDGDKVRAALAVYQQYGDDEFAAEQAMLEYYDQYAFNMNKIASSKKGSAPKWNEIAAMLKDNSVTTQGSAEAKRAFEMIGMFSNTATNTREAMDQLGFGTQAAANPEQAFQADIIRAYLEQLEQDAISSKKIIQRLAEKKKGQGMGDQEAIDSAYQEVANIITAFKEGDYQKAIGLSQEYGVFEELKGGKQIDSVRAAWAAANPKVLEKMAKTYGLANFAKLDATEGTGITEQMLLDSFGALEGSLKPGQKMSDVFSYTKAIDKVHTAKGDERADMTYHKGGVVGTVVEAVKEVVAAGVQAAAGVINILSNAIVNIQGGATINGDIQATGTIGPNGEFEKAAEAAIPMFDAFSGKHKEITAITNGNLNTEGGKHEYTGTDAKGNKVSSDNPKDNFITTTGAFSKLHMPENPYNWSGKQATAFGTLAHSYMEKEFGGDADLDKAREQYFSSFENGGAGTLAKEEDLAVAQTRAQMMADVARQTIDSTDKLLTEHTVAYQVGDQRIGGQADMIQIHRNDDGSFNTTYYDWKTSQQGGEEDINTRGERVVQQSSYNIGFKAEVEDFLNKISAKNGDTFDDETKKVVESYGLVATNAKETAEELKNLIASLEEGKAQIVNLRSFQDTDGQFKVERIEGNALSTDETLHAIENANQGRGVNYTNLVDNSGMQTTGYYTNGANGLEQIGRPESVEKALLKKQYGANAGSDSDINKYMARYKEMLRYQQKINLIESDTSVKTAEEAEINQELIKAYKERMTKIKEMLDELKSKQFTEEQVKDLETREAVAKAESASKTYKGQQKQIANNSFFGGLATSFDKRIESFFEFEAVQKAMNAVSQSIRKVIDNTVKLDACLVDIRIATGYTIEQTQSLLTEYSELASQVGKTTQEVAQAANEWLRAGYEGSEATELVTASMYLSTLGMMSSSSATEALISVLKGWKLETDEVIGVVDKLVTVDMNAAVSAGDIAQAMARVNYSAQSAGISMNTLIGILTVGQEVSQRAPEEVGNAWRTVIARIQNVKSAKFAASYSDLASADYNESDWEALNDVETTLKAVGISLRDSAMSWRNTEDVLNEIASKWDTFDDVTRSAIANSMAGTRQREQFILMMSNWEDVQRYAELAADSYGAATAKMEAYTDSIEAAKNRVTAAWEALSLKFNLNGLITDFYNAIAFVVDHLVAITTSLAGLSLIKILYNLKTAGSGLVATTPALLKYLISFGQSVQDLTLKFKKNGEAVQNNTNKQNSAATGGSGASNSALGKVTSAVVGISTIAGGTLGGLSGSSIGSKLGEKFGLNSGTTSAVGSVLGTAIGAGLVKGGATLGAKIGTAISPGIGTAIGTGVGALVGAGTSLFVSMKTYFKDKAEQERIEESQKSFQESETAYTEAAGKLSYAKTIDELISGVSASGENLALTDEEYEEFLEANNELAETFPYLVDHYDESGNAILDLGSVLDTTGDKATTLADVISAEIDRLQREADEKLMGADLLGEAIEATQNAIGDLDTEIQTTVDENNEKITNTENRIQELENENAMNQDRIDVLNSPNFYDVGSMKDSDAQFYADYLNTMFQRYYTLTLDELNDVYLSDSPLTIDSADGSLLGSSILLQNLAQEGWDLGPFAQYYSHWSEEGGYSNGNYAYNPTVISTGGLSDTELEEAQHDIETNNATIATLQEDIARTEKENTNIQSEDYKDTQVQKILNENLSSYIQTAFRLNDNYSDLSETGQLVAQNIITGMDEQLIADTVDMDEEHKAQSFQEKINTAVEQTQSFFDAHPEIMDLADNMEQATSVGSLNTATTALENAFNNLEKAEAEDIAVAKTLGLDYNNGKFTAQEGSNVYASINEAYNGLTSEQLQYVSGLSLEAGRKMVYYGNQGLSFDTAQKVLATDSISENTLEGSMQLTDILANVDESRIAKFFDGIKEGATVTEKDVAESFADLPEATRNAIQVAAQEIADGKNTVIKSMDEVSTAIQTQLMNSINQTNKLTLDDLFATDWDTNSNGIIDTFKELKNVLDEIAESYEKLKSAQEEQNRTGHISFQTALDLVTTNEAYLNCLEVQDGKIRLTSNAQKTLALAQMQAAQSSLDEMRATLMKEAADIDSMLSTGEKTEVTNDEIGAAAEAVKASNDNATALATEAKVATETAKAISKLNEVRKGGSMTDAEYDALVNSIDDSTKQTTVETAITAKQVEATGLTAEQIEQYEKRWKAITGHEYDYEGNNNVYDLEGSFQGGDDNAYTTTYEDGSKYTGLLGVSGAISQSLADAIKKGDYTDWVTDYTTAVEDSKEAWERIADIIAAINKEFQQMVASGKVFGNNIKQISTSTLDYFNNMSTEYYDALETMYNAELKALATSPYYGMSLTQINNAGLSDDNLSKALTVYKEVQEVQVKIANLDDEEVQDKLDVLEAQGHVNDAIIQEYKNLVKTADTVAERIEYEAKLNDKLREQVELVKTLKQYQKKILDFELEYESGDTSTTRYKSLMKQSKANLEAQKANALAAAQTAYQNAYDDAYDDFIAAGYSAAIANSKAIEAAEMDADYQSSMTDYMEAYQALGELIMQEYNDNINILKRRLTELETSKPNEWASDWNAEHTKVVTTAISKMKTYYDEVNEYYKDMAEEAQQTLTDSSKELTDAQIQELTEQYNEAMKNIRDNSVTLCEQIKSYQESVYSALTNEVTRYKDQLEEQKELVEEYYDKEIEKLTDKNTAIERTNKLLELQQNLLNAQDEKEKVWRNGVGWVDIHAQDKEGLIRLKP